MLFDGPFLDSCSETERGNAGLAFPRELRILCDFKELIQKISLVLDAGKLVNSFHSQVWE